MTTWWFGAFLGLVGALGAVMAYRAAPPNRPLHLGDRIAPYLVDTPAPSRLLAQPGASAEPFRVLRSVFGPAVGESVRWLDRLVGGAESVRRRLGGLGSSASVEEFRVEQIIWGAVGAGSGLMFSLASATVRGAVSPVLLLASIGVGGIAGVLGRDWWLTQQLQRRERTMLAEFPVIADLLALSVIAGEAPIDALNRVCRLTRGELTTELRTALDAARAGAPVTRALAEVGGRSTVESFGRFIDGLIVAIERGTPLAEVLRAQAVDVREESKRSLLEAGGRKELHMMVPVVFLILPVTVLFALYPGLVTLVSLSG